MNPDGVGSHHGNAIFFDKIMVKSPEVPLTLYKLTGENSPFTSYSMPNLQTGEKTNKKILEFFQYIIYAKDSKPCKPLKL